MKKIGSNIKSNIQIKLIFVFLGILLLLLVYMFSRDNSILITKTEADILNNSDKIEQVLVDGDFLYLKTDNDIFRIYKYGIDSPAYFAKYPVEIKSNSFLPIVLGLLFVIALLIFLFYYFKPVAIDNILSKKITKSKDEEIVSGKIKAIKSSVEFKDVAGIDDVKEELEEIIDFLKYPKKYKEIDLRLPKGLLLVGPPGVGKTMIAKAVAGEASVPFYYQSGASFVQIYVGMGAKRVSELFMEAKKNAPSIIFIDEIDAVGKSRTGHQNDEREATLNQLLTEMDGFEDSAGVIVIGATNKIEVLDEALLRAGRFDRRIFVSLPDFDERVKTLELYLAKKNYILEIDKIAKMSVGFSSASLSAWVNEAAFNAFRNNNKIISIEDFEAVKEKVSVGKKRVVILSNKEREIKATYQAAKALIASLYGINFDKIGISETLFHAPSDMILSKKYLFNLLMVKVSGTIATEIKYNDTFDIGDYDIKNARDIAFNISNNFDILISPNGTSDELLNEASQNVKKILMKFALTQDDIAEFILENESITQSDTFKMLDNVL